MKKSFSIKYAEPTGADDKPEIEVNGETFELADDLAGMELLLLIGNATSSNIGVHRLFSRAIRDEDWDRFVKITDPVKDVREFGKIANNIINVYAGNPTTAAPGS